MPNSAIVKWVKRILLIQELQYFAVVKSELLKITDVLALSFKEGDARFIFLRVDELKLSG